MTRTGAEYLAGLRDGRRVGYAGEVVADVSAHPHFAAAARTVAGILDLELDDRSRAALLADDGIPWMYRDAHNAAEVRLRGRAFGVIARHTYGLLGRSPDFLATLVTAWASAAPAFGPAAESIRAYHVECVARRLCHAHAIVDPPSARRATGGRGDERLRIVERGPDGVVVSGTKMMATMAPFADELLVYPWGRPLAADEAEHAVAFALPIATPGLSVLCRPGYATGSPGDQPLASRFDEMDALCVFDRVTVPNERLFVDGDPALANDLHPATSMVSYMYHQLAVRAVTKANFALSTAAMCAEAAGKEADPRSVEPLGELAAEVQAMAALVQVAEARCHPDRHRRWVADLTRLAGVPTMMLSTYPRILRSLRTIMASAGVLLPSSADLSGADAQIYLDHFETPARAAPEHVALLRIAAELTGSGFGARQDLYEQLYLGPPERVRASFLRGFDLTDGRSMVTEIVAATAKE